MTRPCICCLAIQALYALGAVYIIAFWAGVIRWVL